MYLFYIAGCWMRFYFILFFLCILVPKVTSNGTKPIAPKVSSSSFGRVGTVEEWSQTAPLLFSGLNLQSKLLQRYLLASRGYYISLMSLSLATTSCALLTLVVSFRRPVFLLWSAIRFASPYICIPFSGHWGLLLGHWGWLKVIKASQYPSKL